MFHKNEMNPGDGTGVFKHSIKWFCSETGPLFIAATDWCFGGLKILDLFYGAKNGLYLPTDIFT